MNSSSTEFKKLQAFWQAQEANNLEPHVPCVYFRKRKLIKDQIFQSNLKSANPAEENTLKPVSNKKFDPESLRDESTIPVLSPVVIITDVDSSSDGCSKPDPMQLQYHAEEAESNVPNQIEDEFLNKFFDPKLSDEFTCENQLLSPDSIINNDSDSLSSVEISIADNDSDSCNNEPYLTADELISDGISANIKDDSEVSFFDDDWHFQRNHIFVLSFVGKPIFSLQRHGYEDKMLHLFGPIACFINIFEKQKDRISSIVAEGMKFVFLIRNALYLVAVSRDNISEHHLKLQLREVYNRIGFLLTFASLNRIFEDIPGYDLRQQLSGTYNLISNQLTTKIKVSNNVFTLFTNSIRVLPLHPALRSTITNIIKRKCSRISNLAFALLIVDGQLVTLVRLKNHTIHAADIRLIFNLIECSENNFNLWMLPICLPNFNKDCFLHAYISSVSDELEASLILLSYDRDMVKELSQAHTTITKTLHGSSWFTNICKQIKKASKEGYGFNVGVIKIPELWHFLYMPKSSNHQLLCSKIIPPYTCLTEFKRLEAIYRDLHHRLHNKNRSLELIFEVKEKEVAVALETDTAEIYAVFNPLVNKISVAKQYVDELIRWISWEKEAYFIRKYPKF